MRKYYTRPCNFYYGNYAKKLIKNKKALPLAGNNNIAFDKVEIFQRIKKEKTNSAYYSISKIKNFSKEKKLKINNDLKKNNFKKKKYLKLKI